ncbi:hypothetical protein B0T11DRAFT_313764 [Plectosphaerella cucumerina]|uniref:Uncharacterized protein n=1 Tax=Plectosphaerella cucumerina TaxID=40658 RepID=A0A8K0TRQ1_9PEZI|nr:hypothetical protein B0T11DRAFT_313764 [Plectosphaerella cucumerina]
MSYAEAAMKLGPVAVQRSTEPAGKFDRTRVTPNSIDWDTRDRPGKSGPRIQGPAGGVAKVSYAKPKVRGQGNDFSHGSRQNHYTGYSSQRTKGNSYTHLSRGPRRVMIEYTDSEKRTPSVDYAIDRYLQGSSLKSFVAVALVKGTPRRFGGLTWHSGGSNPKEEVHVTVAMSDENGTHICTKHIRKDGTLTESSAQYFSHRSTASYRTNSSRVSRFDPIYE